MVCQRLISEMAEGNNQDAIRLLATAIERSKVNVPPPPVFGGTDSNYRLQDFLALYEEYAQSVYGPKSRSWVLALQTFVTGEAKSVLSAIGVTHGDYDTVKASFRRCWAARRESSVTPQERFLKAEHLPGESLQIYSLRLRRLAGEAFPQMDNVDEIVLPKFLLALDNDTRKALEAYMLVMPDPALDSVVPLATTLSANRADSLPALVCNVNVPKLPENNSEVSRPAAGESTLACGHCGSPYHRYNDCRVRTAECFNCHAVGHLAARCPAPRAFGRRGNDRQTDERSLGRGNQWAGAHRGRGGPGPNFGNGNGGQGPNFHRGRGRPWPDPHATACAFCGSADHRMAICVEFWDIIREKQGVTGTHAPSVSTIVDDDRPASLEAPDRSQCYDGASGVSERFNRSGASFESSESRMPSENNFPIPQSLETSSRRRVRFSEDGVAQPVTERSDRCLEPIVEPRVQDCVNQGTYSVPTNHGLARLVTGDPYSRDRGVPSQGLTSASEGTLGEINLVMEARPGSPVGSPYYVEVKVNGVTTEAMLDPGASVTLASEDFVQSSIILRSAVRDITPRTLSGFGPNIVVACGAVTATISIADLDSPPVDILVAPPGAMRCDMILGIDFLEQHYLTPNLTSRTLVYNPPSGELREYPVTTVPYRTAVSTVKIASFVQILPQTRRIVKADLSDSHKLEGRTGYFEPTMTALANLGLSLSSSRCSVIGGTILVEIINPQREAVVVSSGTVLGSFRQSLTHVQRDTNNIDKSKDNEDTPTCISSNVLFTGGSEAKKGHSQSEFLLDLSQQVLYNVEHDLKTESCGLIMSVESTVKDDHPGLPV